MSIQNILLKLSVVLLSLLSTVKSEAQLDRLDIEKVSAYEMTLEKIWTSGEKESILLNLIFENLRVNDPILAATNFKYIKKAIDLSQESELPSWEAQYYDKLGLTHSSLSQKDSSELAHEKSLELFKGIGDIENQIRINHTLITSYAINNASEKALKLGYEALGLCPRIDDGKCNGLTYYLLAMTMYNFNEIEKGSEYGKKAIALLENTSETKALADCYAELAKYGSFSYEESKGYLDKALAIVRSDASIKEKDLADIYMSRVLMFQKYEQYEEAEKDLDYIVNSLLDKMSVKGRQCLISTNGKNKYHLGKHREAIDLLQLSFNDAFSDIDPYRYYNLEYIENSYEALGQLDSAYYYHKLLHELEANDRVHESRMKMKELETKYEAEKKELTIDAQNQTIAKQRIIQWLGLGATVLLGLLLFQTYRNSQQRRRANQQLVKLDHLKTHLYTNITHEFRTPLTVILGVAGQLKRDPKKYLNSGTALIQKNGERLMDLINQMLDLSKLESGAMTLDLIQSNIVDYVRDTCNGFETYAANKNISIHFFSEEEEIVMDYDEEKIRTVLINLFSNAIKFTPEEGHIYVMLRQIANTKGDLLQITFKDTGIGIDEEKLPHIFDRFYQTDYGITRKGEGTGIGLALVREYIHLMDGTVNVKSKKGKETAFTILLPITRAAEFKNIASRSQEVKIQNEGNHSNPEERIILQDDIPTILLIEDNLDIASYIASCLDSDYNVIISNNGKEGVALSVKYIPDLVITDVMMPIKDGYEVCVDLKTHHLTSHIPLIMLTAKADKASKLEGLKNGADAYLFKPFDQEELLTRITNLLTSRKKIQTYYLSLATGEEIRTQASKTSEIEDEFLIKLTGIVNKNISDSNFTVESFTKQMLMSSSQFHRKVTGVTGLSPMKFVRHIRLSKAKRLLTESDESISAIAFKTGYNDPAYFSRIFKKEYDVTPLQWRTEKGGTKY